MAKNTEWNEDSETLGIARKLLDKYPEIFENLDLQKIKFVRDLAAKGSKLGELKSCGFPYDIDSPYIYYLVINNSQWKNLSEAQQVLAVMHFLYAVAPGGTDETGSNYAKTRQHDVKDYNVVLAAAGGNFEWMEPGMEVPNPLSDNMVEKTPIVETEQ